MLRNPIETFSLRSGEIKFCYKKFDDGEEEIHLIQKAIEDFLKNESEVYKSI
uniref:hypothetical protein n=1 Tax=Bacillus multifaciens TaxID=3068506 RepID=UPI003F4919D8